MDRWNDVNTDAQQLESAKASDAAPLGHCPRCGYAVVTAERNCPECGLNAASLQSAISNQKSAIPFRPWLHRFAIAFVLATFILIVLGGTVTSKGAGLAVPDWPGTFSHNMFLFPPALWVGNIFWEHTHRLMGSLVGFMGIVMCIALWRTNRHPGSQRNAAQSPRTPVRGSRRWLQYLGVATLIMVIAQGIMGGLRVTQLSTWLAVFHGMTAQIFLCMTVLIAAATSRWWVERERHERPDKSAILPTRNPKLETRSFALLLRSAIVALVAIFIQLALGATVRHHGAGLAIPDFPLSYGQILPPLSQSGIEKAMIEFADNPDSYATSDHGWYSPFHVVIHWSHRLWAIVVIFALHRLIHRVMRTAGNEMKLKVPAGGIGIMLLLQLALGASIIWTGRHTEVATAHQTLGAILLATTALLFFRIRLLVSQPHALSPQPRPAGRGLMVTQTSQPLQTQGAGT